MARTETVTEIGALTARVAVLEELVGRGKIDLYHEGIANTEKARARVRLHVDLKPFREKLFHKFCKARLDFGDGRACYRWGIEGAYKDWIVPQIDAGDFGGFEEGTKRLHVRLTKDELNTLISKLDGVGETILRTPDVREAMMPSYLGVAVKAKYRYPNDCDESRLEVQTIARGVRSAPAAAAPAAAPATKPGPRRYEKKTA